jgi:hypothetical protein
MLFAVLLVLTGDQLTSRQWTYLMDVPGGQLFWGTLFAAGALAGLLGTVCHAYRITAAGMCATGFACLLIAAFYLFAPLIDPGMYTLGYVPWFIVALITFCAAVFSWAPIRWF